MRAGKSPKNALKSPETLKLEFCPPRISMAEHERSVGLGPGAPVPVGVFTARDARPGAGAGSGQAGSAPSPRR